MLFARPTRKSYNILLDAFAVSGLVEEARTVFKTMRRHRYVRLAFFNLKEVQKGASAGFLPCHTICLCRVEPDLCSYTIMLLAYVNASDMDGAEKFFRRIKDDGLRPNVVAYGTLMKGYSKLDDVEKVMRVYERMRMQGVEPNQTIFTTIMDAHGRNSDFGNAVIWFNEMETRGYPPDKKAKNILLSLAKTPEEQEEANELTGNGAVQLEVKPNGMPASLGTNGADVHEGGLTDSTAHHHSLNGASTSDLNGRNRAGSSGFEGEGEDDDDDDYEEMDDEELDFVSFKDKRELNFAT